ncbi:transcription factor S-II-domain-containing protein [Limtongia smithiae]|uniref:transcription factor S-II-domain-containing protein n=1 Tax=Limtongia smithiae TaxID=1125753 RepID=UPI0034CE125E
MSVIGSLIFCTDCGNLLDAVASASKVIKCSQCLAEYPTKDFENLIVTTRSAETAFPSSLRQKKSVVKTSLGRHEQEDEGATIKEKCPQCGKDEMQYYSLQLRSADEGATVFYSCTDCGYKFSTNN